MEDAKETEMPLHLAAATVERVHDSASAEDRALANPLN